MQMEWMKLKTKSEVRLLLRLTWVQLQVLVPTLRLSPMPKSYRRKRRGSESAS